MNLSVDSKLSKNSKNLNTDTHNNKPKRSSLICNLCKDFFKNPVQCSECEIAFCKDCITRWYLIKNSCPKGCNITIEKFKHTPKCFNDILEELRLEEAYELFEHSQNHSQNSPNHENREISLNEICWNCKQCMQANHTKLIVSEQDYLYLLNFKSEHEKLNSRITDESENPTEKNKMKANINNTNMDIELQNTSKESKESKESNISKESKGKILFKKLETTTSTLNKINESSEFSNIEENFSEFEFNEPRESKKSSNITDGSERGESKKKKLKKINDKHDKNAEPEKNSKTKKIKQSNKPSEVDSDSSLIARSKKNQKKVDYQCMEIFGLKTISDNNNTLSTSPSPKKHTDESFKQFFNNYKTFKNTSTIKTDDEVWSISSFTLNNTPIVVNGDSSGSINFWNVKNNILFNYIEGTVKESCNCLLPIQINSEYEYIAASCYKDINIYHIKTGKLYKKLTGHTNAVCCLLKFEISGKWYIASGSVDNTIIIWEYEKLCFVKILLGAHSSIIYCLEKLCTGLNEKTNLLVSGSVDTTIKIWNVEKGTTIRTINNDEGQGILALLVIKVENKEVLLSGDSGGKIKMWDPIHGNLIKVFICKHKSKIWSIKTIELLGETLIVSGSDDGNIKISNPSTGNMVMYLPGHSGSSWCLTTIDLNETIAIVSGSNDKTLKVWKLVDRKI